MVEHPSVSATCNDGPVIIAEAHEANDDHHQDVVIEDGNIDDQPILLVASEDLSDEQMTPTTMAGEEDDSVTDTIPPLPHPTTTDSTIKSKQLSYLSGDVNNNDGYAAYANWKMEALESVLERRREGGTRSCLSPGFFTIAIPTDFNDELSEIGSDLQSNFHPQNEDLDNNNRFNDNRTVRSGVSMHGSMHSRAARSQYLQQQQSDGQYLASPDSKYESYSVCIDRDQDDKAMEIPLCSIKRPHMRGFHFAWMSMYVGFFIWFAITPLMGEIQDSLHLTKKEVWTSSVYGTVGTIITRLLMGPLCDKYGSRLCMATIIFAAAIPSMALGVVNSSMVLNLLRLSIGVAGAAFVAGESWTSSLFTKEIAGTALSIVSGWGNLGGAIAQIIMGAILFPILKVIFGGDSNPFSAERAWRTAFALPGILGLLTAYMLVRYSDDSPKGNYLKRERQHLRVPVSAVKSMKEACMEVNTWILFVQYSCCFGVEFAMNNAAVLYFRDEFDLTTEQSAAVASVFGWMNLFARGLGGFVSDICNARYRMRGRIIWMFIILLLEGASIILFAVTTSFPGAVMAMVVFSLFVQAAEGSVYAIVPYVNASFTGSVSGVVGAGGTVGGAAFAILFREFDYQKAFFLMGVIVAGSSLLSFTLSFEGFGGICCWSRRARPSTEHGDQNTDEAEVTADDGTAPSSDVLP